MENLNGEAKPTPQILDKKKRKTLDDLLGINGLLIGGVIGNLLIGGVLEPILFICGVGGFIYLIKKRKELTKKQRWAGWILAIVWILSFGLKSRQY